MKTRRLPVSTWVALEALAWFTASLHDAVEGHGGLRLHRPEPGTATKARSSTSVTLWRSDGRSAPQAVNCWRAVGSSVIDSSRCSRPTVS
jgi:hypothetical protein